MATTHDDVADEVQDIVVSGTTDAIISRWLNRRYRELVAKARWRTSEEEIDTTVDGTSTYDLTPGSLEVYEVLGVKVVAADDSEVVYEPAAVKQGWGITDGTLSAAGAYLFAPAYGTSGTVERIKLIPTPSVTGSSIVCLLSLYPTAVSGTTNLIIPDEFATALVQGIAAIVMSLDDEQQNEAAGHEAAFQQAITDLGALKKRRSAPGPMSVPVVGYNT